MNKFQTRLILLWLVLLACLPGASWAAPTSDLPLTSDRFVLHTDQESIEFHPVRIDSALYVATDDGGLTRLLSLANTTFSWSSDRGSLFIHAASGDVHWDTAQNQGTIGTDTLSLPGAMVQKDGNWYIQVSVLVRMLGLSVIPVDAPSGSYAILPSVQNIQALEDHGATQFIISGTGRLTCETVADAQGVMLVFPQTGCLLPDELTVGPAHFRVDQRGSATQSSRVLVTFPPHWKGVLGAQVAMNQVILHMGPDFAAGEGLDVPPARITSMAMEGTSTTQTTWRLDGTSAFSYAWQWDAENNRLILNILHATPVVQPPTSQDVDNPFVTHIDTEVLPTDPYPMIRVTFKLAAGTGFKVDKVDGEVKSVRLTLGPQESVPVTLVEGSDTFRQILHGVIVLDPGHGGSDPGCHSPRSGLREKDVTLDICLKMKAELEQRGLKVILTRYDDRDLTYAGSPDAEELGARASVANQNQADVFVSIHCNASVSSSPRGAAVHWYKDEDYALAQLVREGIEGASLGVPMNGLIRSRFYVLRHTAVPSILVETAYLTNPTDGDLLGQDGFRHQMAVALSDGLAQYMDKVAHVGIRPARRTATVARPPVTAASQPVAAPTADRPTVQPLVFPMDKADATTPAPAADSVTPATPAVNAGTPSTSDVQAPGSGLREP